MWYKQLIARLFNKKVVWLQTHDGAVYLRLATPTPFGLTGYLWPAGRIAPFTCLPDGTCSGTIYIERWRLVDGQ
jgi:hypothetical protein